MAAGEAASRSACPVAGSSAQRPPLPPSAARATTTAPEAVTATAGTRASERPAFDSTRVTPPSSLLRIPSASVATRRTAGFEGSKRSPLTTVVSRERRRKLRPVVPALEEPSRRPGEDAGRVARVAHHDLRPPVGEAVLVALPGRGPVGRPVDPAAGRRPDVVRVGRREVEVEDLGVLDHPAGDPLPRAAEVRRPEGVAVRARVEDARLQRVEGEEGEAASRVERGLRRTPRDAAVLRDLEAGIAPDGDDLPAPQDRDRDDARLRALLPAPHDGPRARAVVGPDEEAAPHDAGQPGPEGPDALGVGDERGDRIARKGRPSRRRAPAPAAVRRPVDAPEGGPRVEEARSARLGHERLHLGARKRVAEPHPSRRGDRRARGGPERKGDGDQCGSQERRERVSPPSSHRPPNQPWCRRPSRISSRRRTSPHRRTCSRRRTSPRRGLSPRRRTFASPETPPAFASPEDFASAAAPAASLSLRPSSPRSPTARSRSGRSPTP